MTGGQLDRLVQAALASALSVLRQHGPSPQDEYYAEYQHALTQVGDALNVLRQTRLATNSNEVLDVNTVQDLAASMLSSAEHG